MKRLTTVWLVSLLMGCSSVFHDDLAGFFYPEITKSRTSWMSGNYGQNVPRLFELAARKNLNLDAVVVTQHSYHMFAYSLFIDDLVHVNFVSGSTFVRKGLISRTPGQLISLAKPMESEGKCTLLSNAVEIDGEILIYRCNNELRVCQEPSSFYAFDGHTGYLRSAFWKAFEYEKVDWFYANDDA